MQIEYFRAPTSSADFEIKDVSFSRSRGKTHLLSIHVCLDASDVETVALYHIGESQKSDDRNVSLAALPA